MRSTSIEDPKKGLLHRTAQKMSSTLADIKWGLQDDLKRATYFIRGFDFSKMTQEISSSFIEYFKISYHCIENVQPRKMTYSIQILENVFYYAWGLAMQDDLHPYSKKRKKNIWLKKTPLRLLNDRGPFWGYSIGETLSLEVFYGKGLHWGLPRTKPLFNGFLWRLFEDFYKITFVSKTSVEKIHFLGHLWKYSILKVLMEKCRGIKKWKHLLPSFEYISINLSNRNPLIRPSFI